MAHLGRLKDIRYKSVRDPVSEADRKITDFKGAPYKLDTQEILASNGKVHGEMQKILK